MKTIITALIVTLSSIIMAQNTSSPIQTIEVSGEHTMIVEPDEVHFTINFEEYWEEEFEGKKWEDYKTKVDIVSIENDLINELKAQGIDLNQITLKQSGNHWRHRGKDFLISKSIDLKLSDVASTNELSNTLKTRGIKSMNITKLVNHNIDQHKISAQKEALRSAKQKALALAEVYDQKLGRPLSIIEIDQNAGIKPLVQAEARALKASYNDTGAPAVDYENFRKITVKVAVRVAFEMHP